jgi:hypothetical protein
MSKQRVLWVEDTPELLSNFKNGIEEDGQIEFVIFTDSASAINYLESSIEEISAAVLDIESFTSDVSEEETKNSFCRVRDCIIELKFRNPIEYFAFTGKGKYLSDKASFREEYGCEIFDKNFQSIEAEKFLKEIVDGHITTQILHKYGDAFGLSKDIGSDLLSILLVLERQEWKNNGVFNQIRKVLEWAMKFCNKIGLSPVVFSGTNLTECSMFLGNVAMSEFVPLYIQRSFHSAVSIANDGSHRLSIDSIVKKGEAPYLIRSTTFELLSIINWLKTFSSDKMDVLDRSVQTKEIYNKIHQNKNK